MSKKCCKDNGPKYVISLIDNTFIECEPMSKEEAEEEIAEMINDYAEEDIVVFRVEKVSFGVIHEDVVVEIID